QLRVEAPHRLPQHLSAQGELDRDLVPAVGQLDVNALGHAVVGARNQQNPHVPPRAPIPRNALVVLIRSTAGRFRYTGPGPAPRRYRFRKMTYSTRSARMPPTMSRL